MSDIPKNLQNVRTLEEVVQLLNILFTNLNNQNEVYYDMFFNPEKLDIELERYDETGQLVTVTLPNRAKSLLSALVGYGDPNEISQEGPIGSFYIDLVTHDLYYKSLETTTSWIKVMSFTNFSAEEGDYLKPDGNGSQLTNLNASQIKSGLLEVKNGGTGNNTFVAGALLKGNGTNPVQSARDGEDYIGPNSITGIVAFYPVYKNDVIGGGLPKGWLRCDGTLYNIEDYPRLYNVIGVAHGGDGVTTFGVPDLVDVYIKCWDGVSALDGTRYNGQVGRHTHIAEIENQHTHGPGSMVIRGAFSAGIALYPQYMSGAFYSVEDETLQGAIGGSVSGNIGFEASADRNCWTGRTGKVNHTHDIRHNDTDYDPDTRTGGKNEVERVQLVPIIKY